MEQLTQRRTMAAPLWLQLLLCIVAVACVLQARAQPDSKGFITIDCGLSEEMGYVDNATKLSYAPDAGFIDADTGTNHIISPEYVIPALAKVWYSLRSFPTGVRNCYTLRSLMPGLKYMIRGRFKYGNYDGLDRLPVFDLHIGTNYWHTVNITDSKDAVFVEAIVVVPEDFMQVCLVDTGGGTPFISGLDLRPLKRTLYPQVTPAQGLVLFARLNFGPTNETFYVRYPDDPHDRIWRPWGDKVMWTEISMASGVQNIANEDLFEAPTAVLKTAIKPRNASGNLEFTWYPVPTPKDPSPGYIAILHFAELEVLPNNTVRQLNITVNSKPLYLYTSDIAPDRIYDIALYNSGAFIRHSNYTISINATANWTLPPIINAAEIFSLIPTTNLGTDSLDVSAIMAIKAKYQVKKNWMGDPCVPKTMAWDRLTCSYPPGSPPRITSVNLSSSGLNGDISPSFANLKTVQYLDLSNNNLTGSIPDALSQLPSRTFLDVSGNQLNGSIPSGLLKRIRDDSLDLRYGNNPNLCTNGNSCQLPAKRNNKLAIYIAVPTVLAVIVSVILLLICLLKRKKQGSMNNSITPRNETMTTNAPGNNVCTDSSLQRLENRRFTYKELEKITNNFQRVLGRGGFGYVYDGFLEDGNQVAVKLRSHSSHQGVKEFLAEAQILTRIHHKNLVSMIGYCKDGEYMALVYEYMSEGTLQEHIDVGSKCNTSRLSWTERLRIALESAQGLEYLHKGCNPPLIHRDVKATNILLNARLEARIADFGLSRAFDDSNDTHVSTDTLVGTPGYVDPEYQAMMQPTTKSDVYSFGVVLLELVTGKAAILREPVPMSIIQWVRERLAQGNIEDVVDSEMLGDYDVNSVWKVADIALNCTSQMSTHRPTMTDVVMQLQECIELEKAHGGGDIASHRFYSGSSSENPNLRYDAYTTNQSTNAIQNNTTFEMEHNLKRVPTMATGPSAR
ncbi:unnamed protein product [Triticum turgidum subsp. durum]|uniref:non-specific serine/threonine protein kinase n=1 Tax=Triticum turgidum subsp. durum TaxID=4567 RepID=A0A9R0QDI0_TRITD|nr:unnamed protein product [Triticum turgidum subsp. durum]